MDLLVHALLADVDNYFLVHKEPLTAVVGVLITFGL